MPFELWGDDGYALALVISVKSMYEAGLLSLLGLVECLFHILGTRPANRRSNRTDMTQFILRI